MAELAARLAPWITAECAAGGRLSLRYKSTELHSMTVPTPIPDGWADRVATDFVESANLDARQMGDGTHRYTVELRRGPEAAIVSTQPPAATFGLPITIAHDKSIMGFEYEQPNPQNLMGQLMRHLESRERTAAMLFSAALGTQQQLLAKVTAEVERLHEERLTNMRAVEELLSMRAERELEAKKAEAHVQLMSDAARDLKPLVGAVVKRMLGPKAPDSAGADTERQAIAALFQSLTDEQRQQIASALSPAQQLALMELVSAIQ